MGDGWWTTPIWHAIAPINVVLAVIVVLTGWGLSRVVTRALWKTPQGQQIDEAVRYSLSRLIQYALVILSGLVALRVMGVGLGSLAVVAGALGLGIGFGLQTIAANFVSGLILLFERPIRIGDRVSLGPLEQEATGQVNGYVRDIRLRATVVETPDNISLIVPNSEFVGRTIINWSIGQRRMRIRLSIGVAYDSDLDQVRQIITESARVHPEVLPEPKAEVRLVSTGDSALEFQLLAWIPDPQLRGRVESDLRMEIVRRFREAGVVIPFPQREVRLLKPIPGNGAQDHESR